MSRISELVPLFSSPIHAKNPPKSDSWDRIETASPGEPPQPPGTKDILTTPGFGTVSGTILLTSQIEQIRDDQYGNLPTTQFANNTEIPACLQDVVRKNEGLPVCDPLDEPEGRWHGVHLPVANRNSTITAEPLDALDLWMYSSSAFWKSPWQTTSQTG